jgi:NADPH:quinone reductase-like Zn-dependent oxidoreductase
MMRYQRILITQHGGSEVLKLIEEELPRPQSGQVRVKVLATGVAFTDILIREGLYPGIPKVPFSPGYEIVGAVDEVGSQVSGFEVGQRVAALTIVGGYSEFLCVEAEELIPIPAEVDVAEAVSLVLHYATAYQLLHRIAQVQAHDRILIHGAAGGLGTALLQLGQLAQLQLYGTASQGKHDLVKRLGGIPIDYKTEDFVQRIQQLTDGQGVNVVFDGVGGKNLIRSYQPLKRGGLLVNYGFSSALKGKYGRVLKVGLSLALLNGLKLIPDSRQTSFYSIASLKQTHPEWFRQDLTTLMDLLMHRKIQPIIAARFPLKEAVHAQELLEKSAVQGQLLLLCKS